MPSSKLQPPVRAYAGFGSWNTPAHIVVVIESLGRALAEAGWTLRTGGAAGAESAFERGCDAVGGRKELVGRPADIESASAQFWPETLLPWAQLSANTRALLAQSACQILGPDLDAPAKFLAYWKSTDGRSFEIDHALQIAAAHAVPCVRIEHPINLSRLVDWATEM